MKLQKYTLGHTVEAIATFRDIDRELFDPATVTAVAQPPEGAQVTPTPVNISTGKWLVQVPGTEEGIWYLRVEGEDAGVVKAAETSFCILSSSIEGS